MRRSRGDPLVADQHRRPLPRGLPSERDVGPRSMLEIRFRVLSFAPSRVLRSTPRGAGVANFSVLAIVFFKSQCAKRFAATIRQRDQSFAARRISASPSAHGMRETYGTLNATRRTMLSGPRRCEFAPQTECALSSHVLCISPKGAADNSQGRKPLERGPIENNQPQRGDTCNVLFNCRPVGAMYPRNRTYMQYTHDQPLARIRS
jgi:hypothetical protein